MNSDEINYHYVTYILGLNNIDKNYINNIDYINYNFYDIITVEFIKPHSHQYVLKPYGTKIKMHNKSDEYLIEREYLSDSQLKSSPYVLVKLSNGKFGYLHTENFDPIEFDSQDLIKNKLLDFFIN